MGMFGVLVDAHYSEKERLRQEKAGENERGKVENNRNIDRKQFGSK